MERPVTGKFTRRNYGRGHSYYLDGDKIPGVTSILGDGLAKPALINWAAKTVAGYAIDHWEELSEEKPSARLAVLQKAHYADRDTAGKRGTEVHKIAEKLNKGEEVTVPEELAGHVESYVRFLDEHDIRPVLTECSVVGLLPRNEYAGTLDLVADFPASGGRMLLDIKTARSGVFPDNALQLAAYRWADSYLDADGQLQPMIATHGAAVVHVRADGYSLVPVETRIDVEHRWFLYCRALWLWQNEISRQVVGEEIPPPPHAQEVTP
jgi:hypothetical protein